MPKVLQQIFGDRLYLLAERQLTKLSYRLSLGDAVAATTETFYKPCGNFSPQAGEVIDSFGVIDGLLPSPDGLLGATQVGDTAQFAMFMYQVVISFMYSPQADRQPAVTSSVHVESTRLCWHHGFKLISHTINQERLQERTLQEGKPRATTCHDDEDSSVDGRTW
jgi:hypothetical protein